MFSAGSALCGAAPNMNALIVGRVWAGAGGAGMYLGYGSQYTHNRPNLLLKPADKQTQKFESDHAYNHSAGA